MSRLVLAAMLATSATALAQADGGTPPATPPPTTRPASDVEEVRREVDQKVESAKKEMREEIRAQLATQSVAQGWQEEWVEQNRKLELLELHGYYRVRPDLFNKMDLGRAPDPDGYQLFPRSPVSPLERTQSGANMRLRLEPTLNISEEVRIKMQADVLDNVVFGATPDYAFSRQEREQFGIFSMSQSPPIAGVNSNVDAILIKRVWGEVSTPVGILRFGRMASHWGLGILHNDGNCIDCDHGETVDRVMFVAEPFPGWYVSPMFDMNIAGLTTTQLGWPSNAPYELSSGDDAKSYILAIARRDTDQQAKAKLDNNLAVFNYGVHFTYRIQHDDAVDFYNSPWNTYPGTFSSTSDLYSDCKGTPAGTSQQTTCLGNVYVGRYAWLVMPDIWIKYERKQFRIEAELAAIIGNIQNRSLGTQFVPGLGNVNTNELPGFNQPLSVWQFAGVLQGEYRLLDGNLRIGLEFGYASGDNSPGLGNYPNRVVGTSPDHNTQAGDIDGPQYNCNSAKGFCTDTTINNFRFAQDYRIDNILWRELLGGLTDSLYAKPSVSYQVTDGVHVFASVIGSRTVFTASSPSGTDPWLGIELNGGAKYETEDGFFAQITYAVLFPLGGLSNNIANPPPLDTAQAVRGLMGIRF